MQNTPRLRDLIPVGITLLLFCLLPGQTLESPPPGEVVPVAYEKYYESETAFLADNPLRSDQRWKREHLVVQFSEDDLPLIKIWVNANSDTLQKDYLHYDNHHSLAERIRYNGKSKIDYIERYGADEPWSMEFRSYLLNEADVEPYTDQHTRFFVHGLDQIKEIRFFTVDNVEYGRIHLQYDRWGFLQEEQWVNSRNKQVIRRFVYHHDLPHRVNEIWEYGRKGKEISHVTLEMAPEDALYLNPPPRTGNRLDEAELILRDIETKRVRSRTPALIPKMEYDQVLMKNGARFQGQIIETNDAGYQFRLQGDSVIVTVPYPRILRVVNRWGQQVYPE